MLCLGGDSGHVLAVQVEAPSGTVLYDQKGLQSGQFAFTTKEDGDFKACFTAKGEGSVHGR